MQADATGERARAVPVDTTALKDAAQEPAEDREALERRVAECMRALAAATESMRVASAEQQAVFDAEAVGIVVTRRGMIARCNRTAAQMLGYAADELVGQSVGVFSADETTFERIRQRIRTEVAERGSAREELELLRRDGSRFWARVTVKSVDLDEPGDYYASTVEDITVERAVIAEMARSRTLADEAARVKVNFLANMGYGIRAQVNDIIGATSLALKADPTPLQREYLLKIKSSSRSLLGVIDDVLAFSRIDAGRLVAEHIDFELDSVIGNVAFMVAGKAASKGLGLAVDVAPDVPQALVGDPLRIGQVLINYANNAVNFTERGGITIQVEVVEQTASDAVLRFSVRDTGIGIDEEQRRRLFENAAQKDASIVSTDGRVGLGLAFSKQLAELMGGEVGVESAPRVGSTFWFTVRLGKGTSKGRITPLPTRPNRPSGRVLVVDDDDFARKVIREMLNGTRFAVGAVNSGQAALVELMRAAAAGAPYDAVLLDWLMPEMDGIATARKIQQLRLPKPPCLLMITAYGRDGLVESARQCGIQDVLTKPVSPAMLHEKLLQLLGMDAAGQEPAG